MSPSTCPFEREIIWTATGDAEFPYRARVDGRQWRICVRDWPEEETPYSLLIGDDPPRPFSDWPSNWRRPHIGAASSSPIDDTNVIACPYCLSLIGPLQTVCRTCLEVIRDALLEMSPQDYRELGTRECVHCRREIPLDAPLCSHCQRWQH